MWVFIEPFNFSFFSITGWGIDLDYCDSEWFALEMSRDHSVVFEIASKYCLSDSFVDHDGYSISSDGFLPHAREEVSYPTSEVRGGEPEIPHTPKPEARSDRREELPHAPKPEARGHGQEEKPPRPRPGTVAGKTNPTSKEPWLRGRRRA